MASPPPGQPRRSPGHALPCREAARQDGARQAEPAPFPAPAPQGRKVLPGVSVMQRGCPGKPCRAAALAGAQPRGSGWAGGAGSRTHSRTRAHAARRARAAGQGAMQCPAPPPERTHLLSLRPRTHAPHTRTAAQGRIAGLPHRSRGPGAACTARAPAAQPPKSKAVQAPGRAGSSAACHPPAPRGDTEHPAPEQGPSVPSQQRAGDRPPRSSRGIFAFGTGLLVPPAALTHQHRAPATAALATACMPVPAGDSQ